MQFRPIQILGLSLLASFSSAAPVTTESADLTDWTIFGPCDIYAYGNTPCIAAHSTTRALFARYTGGLYQVQRASDNKTLEITPVYAGGIANAASQDSFCANTSCNITVIYDQSGHSNDLTRAPPGGAASGPAAGGYDNLAVANAAPIALNGHKVYGVSIQPGMGYRNNNAQDTATGNGPQGIYAVLDGQDYNENCCFDYGNAEKNSKDNGAGHMEALYFGTESSYGTGTGSGPWILADLENGLYVNDGLAKNNNDPTVTARFITGIVKGNSDNSWAVRGGDATSGLLTTYFNGPRPSGYNPMDLEGAIILGTGGDNSDGAQGTFYEGIMTATYPADQIEDFVQLNIRAARYSTYQ